MLSELFQKFLLHIARTVHEKALRDRVYQKGEYTEQWQGGDIVIFERHIGIVSDRRNKKRCALCDPPQCSMAAFRT